jgi:CheY-like chemotaxis protein
MILMDVQMPEMDGYEATKRIRGLEGGTLQSSKDGRPGASRGQVPIIAMTANVFREDIEKCLEAGMDDHIGKPLDLDELVRLLHRYLHRDPGKTDARYARGNQRVD